MLLATKWAIFTTHYDKELATTLIIAPPPDVLVHPRAVGVLFAELRG